MRTYRITITFDTEADSPDDAKADILSQMLDFSTHDWYQYMEAEVISTSDVGPSVSTDHASEEEIQRAMEIGETGA